MKIIFLGTPESAIPFLNTLVNDSSYSVVAVITAPDRPQGRKMFLTPSPVNRWSSERRLTVHSPENQAELLQVISGLDFDCGIVVAYGRILSKSLLSLAPLGFLNVHFSLLPRYRGASPIQSAILAGERETGLTVFRLVSRLDAGPILGQLKISIAPEDDSMTLAAKMLAAGPEFLLKTMRSYGLGETILVDQDSKTATYCGKIGKADGYLRPEESVKLALAKLKAFQPWPGLSFNWGNQVWKIIQARARADGQKIVPGGVMSRESALFLGLKDGVLEITALQPAGKKAMTVGEFLRGNRKTLAPSFGINQGFS